MYTICMHSGGISYQIQIIEDFRCFFVCKPPLDQPEKPPLDQPEVRLNTNKKKCTYPIKQNKNIYIVTVLCKYKISLGLMCMLNVFLCPHDEESGGILIYLCPSVRPSVRLFVRPDIDNGLSSSYSFGATSLILCRMFIHIMEVCMSTGFRFSSNILKMTSSWTQSFCSYQLHKGNMVCPANSSYSFRATALIFCRMFIHIMEVCMSTGFGRSDGGIICVLQTHFICFKSLLTKLLCP